MKLLLSILFGSTVVFGWGAEGHRVVARLAEANLNAKARAAVLELLGGPMADVSTWADEVRPQRRETGPWHYINIPVDASRTSSTAFCPKEGCVSGKIDELVKTLTSSTNREERIEALKFLIHFAGDMHQPLHAGEKQDRGGNDTKVVYFGQSFNLHRVWDTELLARMDADENHLAKTLQLSRGKSRRLARGAVEDWVWESHDVARDTAYKNLTVNLAGDYQQAAEPVLRLQLQRGGARLARLINEALGK